jgi:hypothetical protein
MPSPPAPPQHPPSKLCGADLFDEEYKNDTYDHDAISEATVVAK